MATVRAIHVAERAWSAMMAVLLAAVAEFGAAPVHPAVPWTAVRWTMWVAVVVAAVSAVHPRILRPWCAAIIAYAFLARAAVVATGVAGFPGWHSRVIASATYAAVGVAVVFLSALWQLADRGVGHADPT